MDKFATLEPVRLYAQRNQPQKPQQPQSLGNLPLDLHALILNNLPVPDIPHYARCCRTTAALVRDGDALVWKSKWNALGVDKHDLDIVLQRLEKKANEARASSRAAAPPTIPVDDDFGDFAAADVLAPQPGEFGDFVGAFSAVTIAPAVPPKETNRTRYMRVHSLLKPMVQALSSPPHLVLSQLAEALSDPTSSTSPLVLESKLLRILSFWLSPTVKPVNGWESLYASLRSAMDRFDGNLLAAFDSADSRNDEVTMKDAAESSWQVWDGNGDWEMGKVWAEKREIFYQLGRWNPLDNFTEQGGIEFDAMDSFMEWVLKAIEEHGTRAVRVFPPESQVLLSFADRIANEIVGDYISSLLSRARELSTEIYLQSAAASFKETWRMVDAIMEAAKARPDSNIPRTRAEDVVYKMFEANMDEYLDEEVEAIKLSFERTLKNWDRHEQSPTSPTSADTRFLHAQNPAQAKRNVVNSFTNLLLLPVTIVPRTVNAVGGALMTGGSAAVQGIAMLNPQRWGASAADASYSKSLGQGESLFDADEGNKRASISLQSDLASPTPLISAGAKSPNPPMSALSTITEGETNQLDLLLSLDVALELIHENRKALKRVETFEGYPGHYGHRVKDTIEELFILFLQTLAEGHINKGFARATDRMKSYKPAEHSESKNVAPLEQFFELVHIGDTIQSMVQVYFDKELAPHIDRTDFLNAVVREKKKFENMLDDSVAAGLNAGTEVLMNQVDHIITTKTKPREYYPPEDGALELGPTEACQEAIKCLETHCKLLKGSTSKEVLEVFYQEVGIRLISILQKHIKRQIISLNGGFQVIADLNAYNNFISSLKVQSISSDFANLRMLGHVYVVEDAKDLAQIVRDVTRYGGAYRPEDIYEFIQRRSDWKKIEKVVDKTMYNLSFKEDCSIM
ncbi:f-box protein pof6 [Coprinopsis cinerea okayama7|uniref:F-box protein pof6 n=1 Tax=Coprinopsis cinerea (strain Okayama-7 / 130 / ATCC MYA-4618 / FGSC 9003) TaxID=240176 RepID=A8PHC0_COPC7|nr:f-box protein pof6 [Coprinopsis cinerea okayama7\|eukprot:XP_001841382.2 f-box protein pof6 [Coprinopsis cinerea okayama7\